MHHSSNKDDFSDKDNIVHLYICGCKTNLVFYSLVDLKQKSYILLKWCTTQPLFLARFWKEF